MTFFVSVVVGIFIGWFLKDLLLQKEVRSLKELIHHIYIHSGYLNCGYQHMTTEQKNLYCRTIARLDDES